MLRIHGPSPSPSPGPSPSPSVVGIGWGCIHGVYPIASPGSGVGMGEAGAPGMEPLRMAPDQKVQNNYILC